MHNMLSRWGGILQKATKYGTSRAIKKYTNPTKLLLLALTEYKWGPRKGGQPAFLIVTSLPTVHYLSQTVIASGKTKAPYYKYAKSQG